MAGCVLLGLGALLLAAAAAGAALGAGPGAAAGTGAALGAGAGAGPLLPRPRLRPHWPHRPHRPIPPGSDLGLYNKGFLEGDIVPRPPGKNAVSDESLLWPLGAIVYRTDDSVGCPESPQCEILMRAMDHYHAKSCIRFKEWTGERDYVTIFFNPDTGACWSPVGRTGEGEQLLSLGERCWYLGIVVHELGHAIGFWHEMNRPDRDAWIRIFWENILPGMVGAFLKNEPESVDTLGESFDYHSIMLYDEYAFSKDGLSPTLQATHPGVEIGPIWRKPGLSASDTRRLHRLYKCQGNRAHRGFPYDIACSFNSHTCGFKNGGSSVWSWRNSSDSDGYVYSTCERAGATPGYFLSVNLPAAQDSARGCARFWYLLRSDAELVLQLSQVYLDSVTQLSYDPDMTRDLWESQESTGQWVHVEVPIDVRRPFKLIFMSAFSDSCTRGTIALDDVEVQYSGCNAAEGESGGGPLTVPPTPAWATCPTFLRPTTSSVPVPPDSEPPLPPLPPRPAVTQPLPGGSPAAPPPAPAPVPSRSHPQNEI